ncbi:hypothetical protein B0T10DRAFT_476123 [Thelonectria olida]|uniref:DUF4045 domain-containing protein n=1 Tax=Thelonectria olida TaxID=1576542 RepID=A0A9P8WEM9_9HYPO|nr:hypothetical protein B0T10DRAFT_476123 [Thelonectria olida]
MSDEVSQFLEQVERLRGQQIEEDGARAKELEAHLAAKRERQARREERARSISPQKSSPANTPSPRSNRRSIHLSEALRLDSPTPVENDESPEARASAEPEGKQEAMSYPLSSPTKENESPENDTKPTPRPPSRGSALSWQQRPKSRTGGRPLSMLATQNATQRSLVGSQEPSPASTTEESFSKDQIAQALGSKDPSWFRQTADRGANSAAYRKNQVEDEDRLDMSSIKAQLPGMAADKPKPIPQPEPTISTPTKNRLVSPPMLNPPRFDGPTEDKSFGERSVTPTGRTSPFRSNSRSNSPTKGVGGFVQSAMMKRSDSVKRWSVVSPPGLARADTITSSRSDGLPPSRPRSHTRSHSRTPNSSRPTSRHGEEDSEGDATPKAPTIDTAMAQTEDRHLPTSPTKTMDPRRWSPTKSSWLESALNKPESPKPQHKPNTSQPSWMAELNKNKAEKTTHTNLEGGRPRPGSISHRHQVSIGGLMRSTPMGDAAKTNLTGLGGIYSPPPGGNRPMYGYGGLNLSKSAPKLEHKNGEEHHDEPFLDPEPVPTEESKKPEEPVYTPEEPEEQPKEPEKEEAVASPSPPVPSPPAFQLKPNPKPETPPKKDFRDTLRHRQAGGDAPKSQEPEFKAVFGTLRRTKTQNYVAPDELKSNILRGKAALNVTGGPQKTERVDEFKEAILKKKDDFKKAQADGKGITRSATLSTSKSIPEGLAKRADLAHKGETGVETKPAAVPPKPSSPKPIPGPKRIPSHSALTPRSPSSSTEPAPKPAAEPRALPILQKETSAPSRLQGRVGGGKLADRFNPALAGMLARGPPPMAANGGQSNDESEGGSGAGSGGPVTEPTKAGPQLTHMTKGRARGPRRKAPTAAATNVVATPAKTSAAEVKPELAPPISIETKEEIQEAPAPVEKAEETKPASFSIRQQVAAKAALRGKPTPFKQTEPEVTPAPEEKPASLLRKQTIPEPETSDYPSPLRIQKTGDASRPGSPQKLDTNRMSRFMNESASTEASREPSRLTHQRTGSRSPVKMYQRPLPEPEHSASPKPGRRPLPEPSSPTRRPLPDPQPSSPTKVDADPVVSVKNGAALFGGAVLRTPPSVSKSSFDGPASELEVAKTPSRVAARPLPVPPTKEPRSPPTATSPPSTQGTPSRGNDVTSLLSDFFGPKQPRTTPYKVDTAELLSNRPAEGVKIQPLSFQTFQISGEGKKTPVASHFERVLFEQEMYICPHSFTNEAGWKRLEVYFWVGDDVPESTAEDALIFVQKEVKALGAKLVRIQQGKETAEFLQAMGGVIIVRRGSSKKFDSLATNMLCGRRFLGQVAFDEVDFAPATLCAGFPYLITKGGNCYLWKGKGSDVAELSCARLIGMELIVTGELIEYDDGSEPASFWELFEGGSKLGSADHWRLKPNYSKYCSRLFCSDADTRQQIFEVTPFNQRDLSLEHIYVLDAFFEIYIIVGSKAQDQYPSFRNALDFAQEYAILASGLEDRPFVPISTVVLGGIPRDLKRVFRSWRDELAPTASQPAASALLGTPKRGRSLRVVSLTQALQALNE